MWSMNPTTPTTVPTCVDDLRLACCVIYPVHKSLDDWISVPAFARGYPAVRSHHPVGIWPPLLTATDHPNGFANGSTNQSIHRSITGNAPSFPMGPTAHGEPALPHMPFLALSHNFHELSSAQVFHFAAHVHTHLVVQLISY